ncbi:MAG: hypothetical protein GX767_03315 [Firmicutes bacterium]|nr:hypothetical protein [Bacillota bacterium]
MSEPVVEVFATAKWILLFVGLYLAFTVYLGFRYSERINESDDWALASRNLTLPYMVASIVATWVCAGAIMGAAGEAYLWGFQGIIFDPWGPFLTMIIVAFFFAGRIRKLGYSTVVDFFKTRYSYKMGLLYMITQIISSLGWLGGQLVALGIIVHLTTGFSLNIAVIVGAVVLLVSTYYGGFWALSRVDAISFALILIGLIIMFPTVMEQVGGFRYFLQFAENWGELPTFAMLPLAGEEGYLWYTGILGITYYLAAWASVGLGDISCPILLQRALAAKDHQTASRGFLISSFLYLFLGMIPVMIGIAMFTWGLELSPDQAELVLPWVAGNFLPGWAAVLFVVSIAAAIISTTGDSCLIVAAMFGHNIYQHIKPNASSQETLRVVRIATPIVTAIALCIALFFGTVYKLIIFTGAISLCTIFAPYVFGFFWKKANNLGSIASYFAGLISWVVIFFLTLPSTMEANVGILVEGEVYMEWAIWDALYISLVPAAIISIITMVVVSLATQSIDPPKPILDAQGEFVDSKAVQG